MEESWRARETRYRRSLGMIGWLINKGDALTPGQPYSPDMNPIENL
jgi:transposase